MKIFFSAFLKKNMLSERCRAIFVGVLAVVSLLIPFVYIKKHEEFFSVNGFTASGSIAWITMFIFMLLIFARFIHYIAPCKPVIDIGAIIFTIITICYTLFFSKFAYALGNRVKYYPDIGMGLLGLSAILVFLFFIKGKNKFSTY